MSDTPPHSAIIRAAILKVVGDSVRTGMPARVESYDASRQRCDVQPLVLNGAIDPGTGDRVVERLPVITDVPVVMLGTARARVTVDLERGDTVWVMMSSHSLDLWLQHGGEVDPQDDRRHNISDAVAIPGLFDFGSVPGDASTDGMILHGDKVRIGGPGAGSAVVVEDALGDFMTALAAAILAAVGPAKVPLQALQTALGTLNAGLGWTARTSKAKAE